MRAKIELVALGFVVLGLAVLGIGGVIIFLGDWLAGWQLGKPWGQVALGYFAIVLLCVGLMVDVVAWPSRVLAVIGGLLTLGALFDSLDGTAAVLPSFLLYFLAWGFIYLGQTAEWIIHRPRTRRRWLAVGLGIVASSIYLGAAGYYFMLNLTAGPIDLARHTLFGMGLMIAALLNWVGERWPVGRRRLGGPLQICAVCGLPNIVERRTCKRCRAVLE